MENLFFKKNPLQDLLSSLNAVISTNERNEFITDHMTYNPALVYDRNHLFGFGSDTETETENWPKLSADTETNRNRKIYIKHYIKRSAKKNCVMSITKTFIGYTTNK